MNSFSTNTFSLFNDAKCFDKVRMQYYWNSRDFAKIIEFQSYDKFQKVVEKAIEAIPDLKNHFFQEEKMVVVGSGAQRKVSSWRMSATACYWTLVFTSKRTNTILQAIEYYGRTVYYPSHNNDKKELIKKAAEWQCEKMDLIGKGYSDQFELGALSPFYEKFKLDCTHHNIPTPNHIMYKLESIEIDDEIGKCRYEFLIEFCKNKPSEGIYYGCKGIILEGDETKHIKRFNADWEKLKGKICEVLNNTFPGKDFGRRFKLTDNANNGTYWPFWIPLYEDEDINEVAGRAVRIIKYCYQNFLYPKHKTEEIDSEIERKYDKTILSNINGVLSRLEDYPQQNNAYSQYPLPDTAFTYISTIELKRQASHMNNQYNDIIDFLDFLVMTKKLSKNPNYENAYQVGGSATQFTDPELAYTMFIFFDEKNIPWKEISRVVLNSEGLYFGEALRKFVNKQKKTNFNRYYDSSKRFIKDYNDYKKKR